MRKLGLICMALVLALGTLGVGYALWSDTVTIDGTIGTGTVNLDIEEVSSTYVYKVIDLGYGAYVVGDIVVSPTPLDLDQDPLTEDDPLKDELLEVASAVTVNNTADDVEAITMTFTNIFPVSTSGGIIADVMIHYTGSIPAHVKVTGPTWDVAHDNLSAYIDLEWKLSTDSKATWTVVDPETETVQLENCYYLLLNVVVDDVALQADQMTAQGLYGEFDMSFAAEQWNE